MNPASLPALPRRLARWITACGVATGALLSTSPALANGPVVVGSVNPQSRQVTIFEDTLVRRFADGTPITRLYGKHNKATGRFQLLRSGSLPGGGCRTEVFDLIRIEGNRLAIMSPRDPQSGWVGVPQKIFATFDCVSLSCDSCDSSDVDDPLGAQSGSHCVCRDFGGAGPGCETRAPGTGGPYGPGQLVTLAG